MRSITSVLLGMLVGWTVAAGAAAQGVMEPYPDGTSIGGKIEDDIEGVDPRGFGGGLVFAIDPGSDDILDFTYTTGGSISRAGYWRLQGLPDEGEVVLVAFHPNVKRLIWMDTVSLGEDRFINLGTTYATMQVPNRAPEQLEESAQYVLSKKAKALQVLALSGWLGERIHDLRSVDYEHIDNLTRRLYQYAQRAERR